MRLFPKRAARKDERRAQPWVRLFERSPVNSVGVPWLNFGYAERLWIASA